MTIVCGDSHTATHGAFGALAFGIGTSEVEHVLATQTLIQKPAKNMRISVEGQVGPSVTSKDIILILLENWDSRRYWLCDWIFWRCNKKPINGR